MSRWIISILASSVFSISLLADAQAKSTAKYDSQLYNDVEELVSCLLETERLLLARYVVERRGNVARVTKTRCYRNSAGGRFGQRGVMLPEEFFVGIAAELFLRDLALENVDPRLTDAPAIDHGPALTVDKINRSSRRSKSEKEEWVADVNHKRSLDILAECVVRRNPKLARGVIETSYLSADESHAIDQIMPLASACGVSEISESDRRRIRLYLASNYARLAGLSDPTFTKKLH